MRKWKSIQEKLNHRKSNPKQKTTILKIRLNTIAGLIESCTLNKNDIYDVISQDEKGVTIQGYKSSEYTSLNGEFEIIKTK